MIFLAAPQARFFLFVPFKSVFPLEIDFLYLKSHFFSPAAGQKLHVTAQILEICRFSGSGFLEMKGGVFWTGGGFLEVYRLI